MIKLMVDYFVGIELIAPILNTIQLLFELWLAAKNVCWMDGRTDET